MKTMKPKRGEFWFEDETLKIDEDCDPLEQFIQNTKPLHVLSSRNRDSHVF